MRRFYLRALLAVLLPLASSGLARAGINFGSSGNALTVVITDDIHLTFDVGFTGNSLAVQFESTIPLASDPLQRGIFPTPGSTLGGSLPSGSEVVQQYFGGDIVFSFVYDTPFTVSVGDTFTLSAGSYTVNNWFNGGGVLPSSPTTAKMYSKVDGPVVSVSSAQAVPEPGSAILLAVGGLVVLLRRRRSKA